MPERVQIRRDRPWQDPENPAIIVDRRTIFGNPFKVGIRRNVRTIDGARHEVIPTTVAETVDLYRTWITGLTEIPGTQRPGLTEVVAGLRGSNLACWCPPDRPCHADVLLELANRVALAEVPR